MDTYFGPEPVLDEVRYAILSTKADDYGEYVANAATTVVTLCAAGTTINDVYEQAQVIDVDGSMVVTAICELKVIDLLSKEE